VELKKQTLSEIVDYMADIIARRASNGENFGVALIPEGLVEFVPEMKALISELNDLLVEGSDSEKKFKSFADKSEGRAFVAGILSPESAKVYTLLPSGIADQLTLDRDPHGNVQVSLIETEKLLGDMVKSRLGEMKKTGDFKGKFSTQYHFFGYEGRCAAPSNFDADYCYSLGYNASFLIAEGKTGYMSSVRNLTAPAAEWIAGGVPVTMMMNMERRHGHMKAVIQKALVELDNAPFKYLAANREKWAIETSFVYPGPIQYWGPTEVCDQPTKTITLERAK
jgi:pyrophosphate--fructose-6-phosphate 1-phosphotransferase